MSALRKRLTYANVMSTLALFVALGGSAAAGTILIRSTNQLRSGVVNSRVIHNNSVTTRDVKNRSLTGSDVRDGSLLAGDFRKGQLPQGQQGPPGLQGEHGPSAADATLVKGQTLRGVARYRQGQGSDPSEATADAINVQFQLPLAADVQTALRPVDAPKTEDCPGSADAPEAAPGFLCVYTKSQSSGIDFTQVKHPITGSLTAPSRYGFAIEVGSDGGEEQAAYAWAVTAP